MTDASAMTSVLIASHHPSLTTSYGRVTRELVEALRATARVRGVGTSPHPVRRPREDHTAVLPEQLIPAVRAALADHPTDLLITVGDPWMFDGLASPKPRCRWLALFPLDGGPMPREWVPWAGLPDRLVVFSRFAAGLVNAATGRSPDVLYHGVDLDVFRPMDKADCQRRLIGEASRFIVGCVAANQPRKNLPALLRAFARFAHDKPDALLYLHTPIVGHWDLEELTDRHGITDRTRATLNYDPQRGLPDETLAVVYNAFDVFALPTMGEGFGLPLLEAQACGVPTIATDFSACPELLPHPAQRVRVAGTLTMARNVDQAVVDERDLAGKLDALYRDRRLGREVAAAGRELAATLSWAGIREQFVRIVGGVPGGVDSR